MRRATILPCTCLVLLLAPLAAQSTYQKDITFALKELDKTCGHFFKLKKIDWKKVSREFRTTS